MLEHCITWQSTATRAKRPRRSGAPARARTRSALGGGTTGNERLTAATGAVLIVLLAIIGVTIISLSRLLWVHLFVGMLLLGPLALKLGSTGYRFVRYYTANPTYREKGPPPAPLRLIAPVVVASTLAVFASGVALLLIGPSSRGTLLPIHKISFFVWVAFMAIHVLAHLPTVARALRADYAGPRGRRSSGAGARRPRALADRRARGRRRDRDPRHPAVRAVDLIAAVPPLTGMRPHLPHNNTNARESSLRKLTRINRWLIAASVALTGLFVEAAATCVPGQEHRTHGCRRETRTCARASPPSREPQLDADTIAQRACATATGHDRIERARRTGGAAGTGAERRSAARSGAGPRIGACRTGARTGSDARIGPGARPKKLRRSYRGARDGPSHARAGAAGLCTLGGARHERRSACKRTAHAARGAERGRVELAAIDRACSRFRADSELTQLNARAGRPVRVSRLLLEALELALAAASVTEGDVDPTVGRALELSGYDRDWRELTPPTRRAARGRRQAACADRLARDLARPRELDGARAERSEARSRRDGESVGGRSRGGGRGEGGRLRRAREPRWRHRAQRRSSRRVAGRSGSPTITAATPRPGADDRDLLGRPRDVEHGGAPVEPRRPHDAPHHRPAHRSAGALALAHGQRRRGRLRTGEHRDHSGARAKRKRARLAHAARAAGAPRRSGRPRQDDRRLAGGVE